MGSSIKDVLNKMKKLTKETLIEILFALNNHKQRKEGSNHARFFRRKPRSERSFSFRYGETSTQ